MKTKRLFFTLFLLFSMIITSCKVYASDNMYSAEMSYDGIKDDVIFNYERVEKTDWDKYFKKQAKTIKKTWKKSSIHKNTLYDTAYVRVLLFVNKQGKIVSYETKSSCIPYGDKIFRQEVQNTLSKINFATLPYLYRYDFIVFTVKFHSKLPSNIDVSRINWNSYGVADIETSGKRYKSIIKN